MPRLRWPRLLAACLVLAIVIPIVRHRSRPGRAFRAAEELLERGEHRRAVEAFLAVADSHPGDPLAPQALYQAGSGSHLFLRDDRQAVQALRDLTQSYPSSPWARRAQKLLGEIFELRREDYRQAIVEYQRFIGLAPGARDNDEAQLALARCYFKLGDFDQARAEYEVLVERYPESPLRLSAIAGLANVAYVTGRFGLAVRTYRRVIAEAGEGDGELAAEARFGVASSLEETGDLTGALREFESAKASYPNPGLVAQRIERARQRLDQQGGRTAGGVKERGR